MKKLLALLLVGTLSVGTFTACSSDSSSEESSTTSTGEEKATGVITVVSREDGSGTRGAFIEITGVDDGENDNTTQEASIQDGTGKVMAAVAADAQAIGYISLGSVDDSVKTISVDGIEPTEESILSGDYAVARPFMLATKTGEEIAPVAQDLMDFIFSAEGQAVVSEEGFVAVEVTTESYASALPSGTITIGGSTSVYPVMEVLVEAYEVLNPNATINIESIGSTAGMTGVEDGTFDIGMSSRALKDAELEVLTGIAIAQDGIAVVTNVENPLEDVTMEQLKEIYTGEIMMYDELY